MQRTFKLGHKEMVMSTLKQDIPMKCCALKCLFTISYWRTFRFRNTFLALLHRNRVFTVIYKNIFASENIVIILLPNLFSKKERLRLNEN